MWRLIPAKDGYTPLFITIDEEKGRVDFIWEGSEDVTDVVKHILSVDISFKTFLKTLENYPALYRIALKHSGLRPARNLNLYEALIKSVLQQRISLRIALGITAKMVERWGVKKVWKKRVFYSFPPAEKLMKMDAEKIKSLGMAGMKAKSIKEIARNEYEGDIPSIEEVNKNPYKAVEQLTKIYGVGRWTAELSVATVIHDYRIAPAGDLNVIKAFAKTLGLRKEREIREYTENFGKWKGLLMYLMAFSVENR